MSQLIAAIALWCAPYNADHVAEQNCRDVMLKCVLQDQANPDSEIMACAVQLVLQKKENLK